MRLLRTRTVLLSSLLLGVSSQIRARAAEKIQWPALQTRLNESLSTPSWHGSAEMAECRVKVVTQDGRTHTGRGFRFDNEAVVLVNGGKTETLPRSAVSHVEVKWRKLYLRKIREGALFPLIAAGMGCEGGRAFCPVAVFSLFAPPAWAYTAAATPFVLTADGASRIRPTDKYDVIP